MTAFAPGAVAYRWTKNGETVADITGCNLTVAWAGNAQTDVYTVTAIYDVNGESIESEMAAATVESLQVGTILSIR